MPPHFFKWNAKTVTRFTGSKVGCFKSNARGSANNQAFRIAVNWSEAGQQPTKFADTHMPKKLAAAGPDHRNLVMLTYVATII
jgi:hypothetical protein